MKFFNTEYLPIYGSQLMHCHTKATSQTHNLLACIPSSFSQEFLDDNQKVMHSVAKRA